MGPHGAKNICRRSARDATRWVSNLCRRKRRCSPGRMDYRRGREGNFVRCRQSTSKAGMGTRRHPHSVLVGSSYGSGISDSRPSARLPSAGKFLRRLGSAQFEQYIRELTFFGANSIEGIPFQDDRQTPVMKFSRREMNRAIGEICDRYGLDYWVWLPADFDLKNTKLRTRLLDQSERVFSKTPRS